MIQSKSIMDALIIEPKSGTPEIHFNPADNKFKVSKKALPNDPIEFWEPILDWLKQYMKNPNDNTKFEFQLDYYNTATSKQLARFFKYIKDSENKNKVKIIWYYEDDDTDMLDNGKLYAKLIDINFEFISYE